METLSKTTERDIRTVVTHIADLLRSAGGRALMVGGCVRDSLLGIDSKDIDLEVYGLKPDDIRRVVGGAYPLDFVGQSFGVFKVRHYDIDIALPRTENKIGRGHKGFEVVFNPELSVEEAAARRDFTINAILMDPLTGEMLDPWKGLDDLKRGVLRHISDHFAEDPLRVLRCMQFTARFDFSVADETVAMCRTLSQDELPFERLAGEWEKLLLKGRRPSRGLYFLRDCGWICYYPELESLIGCEQTREWHPEGDVWAHTCLAVDEAAARRPADHSDALLLMLAVLCHDFGKPKTSRYDERRKVITCHGHEYAGESEARSFVNRMWRIDGLADRVAALVRNHMHPMALMVNHASDRAFRRLALDAERLDLLYLLCVADIQATLPGEAGPERMAKMDDFLARAQSLSVDNAPPKPVLLGRHLLERGFRPGPLMGKILKRCFEAQLDGAFVTLEDGLRYLDGLLSEEKKC